MSKKTDHTPISHNFARIGGEIECVFIKYVGSKGLKCECQSYFSPVSGIGNVSSNSYVR